MREDDCIVLGIESTAHTFGVGIVKSDGEILSNAKSEYIPVKGGIHPREAAQHHSKVAVEVLKKAFFEAKISPSDLSAIAFSAGPGLGPCLRTGATVARALSLKLKKPLILVNHCVAHVEIGKLTTHSKDPLIVYVSGANTMVIAYSGGRYRVFGETLDIALGNMLDTFAREVGLGHPGTPKVEELAKRGREYISLPYVVKGQDVSYSGLLTEALKRYRELGREKIHDLCYSLIETAYGMLAEVTERALAHTEKKELLLTGGVVRSKRFQEMFNEVAKEHGAIMKVVPYEYAGDNGAMIAWTGILCYKHGLFAPVEQSFIKPDWRIDEVDIPWMH
ncbi:MAG: bifunctional N(6)-L-threonylcarbamoyladenine synthase/serine/threonine protein kinase [Candidatus Methanomethylicota archaeon]|uniref:tRNA N6-adenosine threonylcarbamoyltransferase n=1 Tax=Thermoproteota archaeon TaxID=2056631 RepID=A0A497EU72_9CREN|nr:MAG: bifunctional N(6)-L-threonylcarbamoyladenine synthase/serine/threonine protein kinase [Candidatus Verstraetearchaeota archaeon]